MPKLLCPGCGRRLAVPDHHEGHRLRCPACGVKFRVEAAGATMAGQIIDSADDLGMAMARASAFLRRLDHDRSGSVRGS